MRLENSFDVPAPPLEAWELLNDVPRVVPCMPGAKLTEVLGDDEWRAQVKVKVGPIALTFATDIRRAVSDPQAMRTTLAADAREIKGRGGATASIETALEPTDSGTRVHVATDVDMRGALAQYGRGVVADIAGGLTSRFADNLAAELASRDGVRPAAGVPAAEPGAPAPPAPAASSDPEAVGGLGLVAGALLRSRGRELSVGGVAALSLVLAARMLRRPRGTHVSWHTSRSGWAISISRRR